MTKINGPRFLKLLQQPGKLGKLVNRHNSPKLFNRLHYSMRLRPPENRLDLAAWISANLDMKMPLHSICPHHQTPLDYLTHSFFEQGRDSNDAVVWACRGGGKTMVGAVATLLDLLFKPKVQVRILGGSLEQSEKMYAYLRKLVESHFEDELADPPTQRRMAFKNGSRVEILAQSDRSVRGQRVQKLRCDEVELFDNDVWQAAQLTTRSSPRTRGAVEAFSTMHLPDGLMRKILHEAESGANRKTFAWCIWDVIEKCPESRACTACPLWHSCGGRAKLADGFVPVDDVITMHGRVSSPTWRHEMLCEVPHAENAVFPGFDADRHVKSLDAAALATGKKVLVQGREWVLESVICGVDFGYREAFVCLWIAMMREGNARAVWVLDELVTRERTVAHNAAEMKARRPWPLRVYCDVAGKQVNSQTAISDERVLRQAGFRVTSAGMRIDPGIGAIAELVDPAEGLPRLLIDPRCARLIAAMRGYALSPEGKPLKEGGHDHLIDALRYAVVSHGKGWGKVEVRMY